MITVIGLLEQNTPDQLSFNRSTGFSRVGADNDEKKKTGCFAVQVSQAVTYKHQSLGVYSTPGASNKYTPDGFWWVNGQRNYALVGGSTYYGSVCGGALLNLNGTAGYGSWSLGATLSYVSP